MYHTFVCYSKIKILYVVTIQCASSVSFTRIGLFTVEWESRGEKELNNLF